MAIRACPWALAGMMGSVGVLPLRSDEVKPLELESPLDWQVFQRRDDREGELCLQGRAPEGSDSVIVAIRTHPTPGAEKVRRLDIPFDRSSGRFDAVLKGPAGGWYEVEVTACRGSSAIASTKVPHVGIGQVFVVAGQSNSSNHGSEKMRPTSGKVAAFDGKRWAVADDPQPGASGDGGSFVPAFGDALAARLGLPIGVASVGEGGTSVREWLPRGSRMSRQPTTGAHVRKVGPGEWECTGELFDRLTGRMAALGPRGFRAILWHQGESDAGQARSGYPADRQISGEEYRAFLEKLISDVAACAGEKVTWFTAQATYHSEEDPADEEFRSAQASLWSSGWALQGPDTDLLRGDHRAGVHLSAKGLRRHGEMSAEKVGAWLEEGRGAEGPALSSRIERGLQAAVGWKVVSVSSAAGAVVSLRCENRVEPQGIDAPNPRLSWQLQDERRGARQTAYQVLVATREALVGQDRADAWDSGRVTSDQRIAVRYGGVPLHSETRYWWKVRAWDKDGRPTAWSPPAGFLTGKLRPEDWRGQWIGAALARREEPADVLGFAVEAKRADEEHWVQVDLGKPQRVDRIVLHPMRHNDPAAGGWVDGYAFPVRFRIDVSDDAKFVLRDNLADFTGRDYANPGLVPPAFDARGLTARYARLTVTRLWPRGPGLPFVFTLGELQVFSGSDNLAAGAAVEASASVEGYGWSKRQLTDGKALCPPPGPSPGEKPAHRHGAIYLRKDFELARPVVRAVLSFSGLGFSEAAIDGRKVGDHVIGPGFTDYDHRVPYLTLDVSDRFASDDRSTTNERSTTDDRSATAGRRRLDVILADGWYALDRDPWHQPGLARSPYVDLPKLRLDLRLFHADGSETFVASDESWLWSTGVITKSWIAQEDIDLRKSGETARAWRPAALVPAPRGRLLHQKGDRGGAARSVRAGASRVHQETDLIGTFTSL